MFQLVGCSGRHRDGLVYFTYSEQNTMIMNGTSSWTLKLLDDDTVIVTRLVEGASEPVEFTASKEVMAQVNEIVKRNRMYRYKGYYKPVFEVLDGWSWDFVLKYKDGSETRADGYMRYPKNGGAAFREITDFLEHKFQKQTE